MAPMTRRSQAGGGVAKKAPSRRSRNTTATTKPRAPHDEWTSFAHEDEDGDEDGDEDDRDEARSQAFTNGTESRSTAPSLLRDPSDMNELREMAEKVGRQAEDFAENLDRFLESLAAQRNQYDAVLKLVREFQAIAADAVFELQTNNQMMAGQQLRKEWSQRMDSVSSTISTGFAFSTSGQQPNLSARQKLQVQQLRQWQQEHDIWELFQIVLDLHYNPNLIAVRQQQDDARAELGEVNRYTPEAKIYERFLLDDDRAREHAKIKQWLEQTAEHQETDLKDIVEELESKAGRGKGLFTSGWLFTREKIKGEKRLRTWPSAEESPLPQIKKSDTNEMLVTTLDPDAPARQDRALERSDAYFERAIWITCWEMLRRGKPWKEVSKWCADRNEGWRAISIGKGADSALVPSTAAWRKMCYLASQSEANEYEAAVYGLLGGNMQAMQKACRTVDDQLFAHYSASLARQFDLYVATKFPSHAPLLRRGPGDYYQDQEKAQISLIARLRKEKDTAREVLRPIKIIQSYMIANDLSSMIYTLGHAIAHTDQKIPDHEQLIVRLQQFWDGDVNVPEAELALDPQALRIATHIGIILEVLAADADVDAMAATGNVIVTYIQALRSAGKRDLIPTYASQLPKDRYVATLSRVLTDVTQLAEQEEMLKLLEQSRFDVVDILKEQVGHVLQQHVRVDLEHTRPLAMLEPTEETKLYPGQRIIAGFSPEGSSPGDDAVVSSLHWFSVLSGHWRETFSELAFALRRCLVAGRLGCALSIVTQLPYEKVSLQKTYSILGRSVNLMNYDGAPRADEATKWELLKQQSKTYYELEHVVRAIKALADWRQTEIDFVRSKPKSSTSPRIRDAKLAVDEALDPILTASVILTGTVDSSSDELADLAAIRTQYLPEIILAYNTVLHTAGSLLSRDAFVEAMDLAVTVADEKLGLSDCFVAAGRMRELVTAFAQTSKTMLLMKELGGPRRQSSKKGLEGKDLGMWAIGPQAGRAESGDRSGGAQRDEVAIR